MKAAIKKFNKPLTDLVARDANEGDTRLLVTDMLCEGFGFDKYSELTTEYRVKGEFADYGIRVDKDLIAFLEVKRVTTPTRSLRRKLRRHQSAKLQSVCLCAGRSGELCRSYRLSGIMELRIDACWLCVWYDCWR